MTRAAGRPVPVLAAALVTCGAIVAAAKALLPRLAAGLAIRSPAVMEFVFTLLLFGALALVGWQGRRLAGTGREAAAPPGQALLAGLLVGGGGYLLALLLAGTAGVVEPGRAASSAGIPALLLGTATVLGQSAAEELFFRGWLQPVLVRGWGRVAGILVTAAAFAALHIAGGARSVPELVNLALGGVLFGLLALRSGGLLAPVAAHAVWNWSEIMLFGLDPNPGVGSFGALHDLELVGSAWWGGSSGGMNGSIAMTLVLAALVLPLARARGDWPFRRTAARG